MEKPAVFIASSAEGLAVADAINVNLDHDVHCTLWRNNTFKLGSDGLGDLIKKSSAVDFAIFVFTPDDVATIRKKEEVIARDNVVFELGLFIGSLGRDRCYIVKPRGVEMHLPSDLAGVTTADYVPDRPDGDTASALNAACKQIKDRIRDLGQLVRSITSQPRTAALHVPNPPEYKLKEVDLHFLAQCVKSHVQYPTGLSYGWIANELRGQSGYQISLSAIKLMRLGHIEKTVEVSQEDEYFAYRATEDGLDAFLKHEEEYEAMRARTRGYAPAPKPSSKSGFDDMDDDIRS